VFHPLQDKADVFRRVDVGDIPAEQAFRMGNRVTRFGMSSIISSLSQLRAEDVAAGRMIAA